MGTHECRSSADWIQVKGESSGREHNTNTTQQKHNTTQPELIRSGKVVSDLNMACYSSIVCLFWGVYMYGYP